MYTNIRQIIKMKIVKNQLLFITAILIFISFFSFVTADNEGMKMHTNWPASPATNISLSQNAHIGTLVAYFYEWGIAIGVFIFFVILLFSGFEYITSTGSPDKLQSARKRIISGFAGIMLLMGSFLILNTINPDLTEIKLANIQKASLRFYEFIDSTGPDGRRCEFGFITYQEKDREDRNTRFLIPGETFTSKDNIFFLPHKSEVCIPEMDETKILNVSENIEEGYYFLREIASREEVIEENRAYKDSPNFEEELAILYAKRYEKVTPDLRLTETENINIAEDLLMNRDRNNYHAFHRYECGGGLNQDKKGLIHHPDFNRVRCLEIFMNGQDVIVKEWRRVGYAPLIPALKIAIEGDMETCPTASEIYGENTEELGFRKDFSSGGCQISFYNKSSGIIRGLTDWLGLTSPVCQDQISKLPGHMDNFQGTVDREVFCMHLIRHDPPLDIRIDAYQRPALTVEHTALTNAFGDLGELIIDIDGEVHKITSFGTTEIDHTITAFSRISVEGYGYFEGVNCARLYLQDDYDKCGRVCSPDSPDNIDFWGWGCRNGVMECDFLLEKDATLIFDTSNLDPCELPPK